MPLPANIKFPTYQLQPPPPSPAKKDQSVYNMMIFSFFSRCFSQPKNRSSGLCWNDTYGSFQQAESLSTSFSNVRQCHSNCNVCVCVCVCVCVRVCVCVCVHFVICVLSTNVCVCVWNINDFCVSVFHGWMISFFLCDHVWVWMVF